MRPSKAYLISEEQFRQLIQESYSWAECCRKIGFSTSGSNGTYQIKKRCNELNIDVSHFCKKHSSIPPNPIKYSLAEILVEDSFYKNISRLKKRILQEGLLEYKCAICGNTGEWNGEPLALQLDHINGKHDDHRLCNLRFLCPNCHSQTDTYAGKNIKDDNKSTSS